MTARKAIFGLCAVCAMLFSAFAAQSAMAVSQTAVTCKSGSGTQIPGSNKFSDEHCKTVNSGGSFYHEAFTEETTGELTNETTAGEREPGRLKATVGGVEVIIKAKKIFAQGFLKNSKTAGGEMFATGLTEKSESTPNGGILFTEVEVEEKPCTFTGLNPGGTKTVGSVETFPIHASTENEPFGFVKFTPAEEGGKFAEFELSGEKCPEAIRGKYPVFGVVTAGPSEGATLNLVHNTITEQTGTKLRLKNATTGPIAGLAGKVTIRAGKIGTTTPNWKPIALTAE
jgi:hypothetical protein